ncbi:MAG: tRNA pseudouridine(55) synthase TruB [Spirochaetaceae bacterium]
MQDGLVLLDKPAGVTSFEALAPVKRALGKGKVGHAGTLDRFATGLLIALTGKLTRFIRIFSDLQKHYIARIRFGVETATLDPEGEVTARGRAPSRDEVADVLGEFIGELVQVPPTYSAVHVNGRRAYERVRSGENLSLEPRRVNVHAFDLLEFESAAGAGRAGRTGRAGDGDPDERSRTDGEIEATTTVDAVVEVRCGSGTYVRSLARDVAQRLGTVAHLAELRRTRIGPFRVEEALSPQAFAAQPEAITPARFAERLPDVATVTVDPRVERRIAHGAPLGPAELGEDVAEDVVLLLTEDGRTAGAAERREGRYRYLFVSPRRPA